MNLQEIRAALKDVLDGVEDVRGYDYMPGKLATSSAGQTAVVIGSPENGPYISYLRASEGGQVEVNFELRVFVQFVDLAASQKRLDDLLSAGTGEGRSLFDAIRADNSLNGTVMDCVLHEASGAGVATVAEVQYLAASLQCLVLAQRT
jgi:hypothetical protein